MKDEFSEKAQGWDNPRQIKMADTFVHELRKNITIDKNMKALEIGAGTGLVGLQLLPRLKAVVFEDPSESMLKILKTKIHDLKNAEIIHGGVHLYNRKDIDLVFSNMAFHHITDIGAVLKHLFSITTNKAKIAISDLITEDGSFHRFQEVPHKGFDLDEIRSQFTQAGFNVMKAYIYNTLIREDEPGKVEQYEQFILVAEKP